MSRILELAFVLPPIVLLFAGTALMGGTIGAALIWLLSIALALSIVAGVARLIEAPPNSADCSLVPDEATQRNACHRCKFLSVAAAEMVKERLTRDRWH